LIYFIAKCDGFILIFVLSGSSMLAFNFISIYQLKISQFVQFYYLTL